MSVSLMSQSLQKTLRVNDESLIFQTTRPRLEMEAVAVVSLVCHLVEIEVHFQPPSSLNLSKHLKGSSLSLDLGVGATNEAGFNWASALRTAAPA